MNKQFVANHQRIGIDSNILILLTEPGSYQSHVAKSLFDQIDQLKRQVWTSVVTIAEVLIRPESQSNFSLVDRYEALLFAGNFSFAEIDQSIARQASIIGGRNHLRTTDALILSSLIAQGVTGFITADKDFSQVTDLEVLLIDDKK